MAGGGGGVGFLQGDGIGGVVLDEEGELVTLAVERAAVPLIYSYGVNGGIRHDLIHVTGEFSSFLRDD